MKHPELPYNCSSQEVMGPVAIQAEKSWKVPYCKCQSNLIFFAKCWFRGISLKVKMLENVEKCYAKLCTFYTYSCFIKGLIPEREPEKQLPHPWKATDEFTHDNRSCSRKKKVTVTVLHKEVQGHSNLIHKQNRPISNYAGPSHRWSSAAPRRCKSTNWWIHSGWQMLPGGDAATKKGRLTSSMVSRVDSTREEMAHQNFQSFGTP